MKLIKLLFVGAIGTIFIACGSQDSEQQAESEDANEHKVGEVTEYEYFGEEIDKEGGKSVAELMETMEEEDSIRAKVRGEIEEVCQKKGCWMTLPYSDNESMRIRFKDYGFFVPKDIAGKEVVIEGAAYWDTTSVEMLRHYAEDAEKSKEEIEAITEPKVEVKFEADGVVIKNVKKEAREEEEVEESDA